MSESSTPHPFEALTPNFIMDAVESCGYVCDCRTFALNSYENRVYQAGIEGGAPLIAKFYRPHRWSDDQILEEHSFCFELVESELPVVAPLLNARGESLFHHAGFRFALYPRQGGHAPEFDNLDNLLIMGRTLGRMHAIAATRPFTHRPRLDSASFGYASVALISEKFMIPEYQVNYDILTRDLLQAIDELFAKTGDIPYIRTHGDCHAGNVLWTRETSPSSQSFNVAKQEGTPVFVDFDDARTAPAIQDIWMMLSGDRSRQMAQLAEIVEGYNEFFDFRPQELRLIEALRTLRILHHCAWLGRRWDDPVFPHHFPWFNTARYWGEHILVLREQIAALAEPALQLP
jgi:Ser/Thr protein kinase RdoA (MazF antagonist)